VLQDHGIALATRGHRGAKGGVGKSPTWGKKVARRPGLPKTRLVAQQASTFLKRVPPRLIWKRSETGGSLLPRAPVTAGRRKGSSGAGTGAPATRGHEKRGKQWESAPATTGSPATTNGLADKQRRGTGWNCSEFVSRSPLHGAMPANQPLRC